MAALRLAPVLAMLVALPIAGSDERRKRNGHFFTGRDTTFVNGPIDPDGYVDYEAAANARAKGKATRDTNAVVPLVRCIGPQPEGRPFEPDFYRELGIDPLPDEGEYLVPHYKYFQDIIRGGRAEGFAALEADLKRTPWRHQNSPEHFEWLRLNEAPLAQAVEASRRADYYHPTISRRPGGAKKAPLIDSPLSSVQAFRQIATALRLRVTLRLGQGKPDEAAADALALHRIGRLAARGQCLIELLVGLAIDNDAFQADLAIFEHGKLTAKQLVAYREALATLPPMPTPGEKIGNFERMMMLDLVQVAHRGGLYGAREVLFAGRGAAFVPNALEVARFVRAVDWEGVLCRVNAAYDRAEAAVRLKTYAERRAAHAAARADVATLEARVAADKDCEEQIIAIGNEDVRKARPESTRRVADALLALFTPFTQKVSDAYDRNAQTKRNAELAAALAAHKAEVGTYPEALDDLVPRYIPAVPADLFAGKPLHYRTTTTGYLLYSVGPNTLDDGGKLTTDLPPGDDIGIRLPRGR